jgi:hypothetical protein
MRNFLGVAAIVACSLLTAGAASAQDPTFNCLTCRNNCDEAVICDDFCANKCVGACRARWQKQLNTCYRGCTCGKKRVPRR